MVGPEAPLSPNGIPHVHTSAISVRIAPRNSWPGWIRTITAGAKDRNQGGGLCRRGRWWRLHIYSLLRNTAPLRFATYVEKSTRKSTRWLPCLTRAPRPTGWCDMSVGEGLALGSPRGDVTIPCWAVRPGSIDALSRLGESMVLWTTIWSINGTSCRPCFASETTLGKTICRSRETIRGRLADLRLVPGLLFEVTRPRGPEIRIPTVFRWATDPFAHDESGESRQKRRNRRAHTRPLGAIRLVARRSSGHVDGDHQLDFGRLLCRDSAGGESGHRGGRTSSFMVAPPRSSGGVESPSIRRLTQCLEFAACAASLRSFATSRIRPCRTSSPAALRRSA